MLPKHGLLLRFEKNRLRYYTFPFSFASHAFFAQADLFFFVKAETGIAYPFAAFFAKVKLYDRFQISLFKGGFVFLRPYHLPGFLVLNGYAACFKRHGWAFPFLAADVAVKAERKAFFVRVVCCFLG
jgi:hypothetical protein